MKTYNATCQTVKRDWYLVDADGLTLGRLAAEIAHRLRGKHKPEYTPHIDAGDYIIVVNAEKVKVTGNKGSNKIYNWHTQYPGGIKSATFNQMIQKHPERVIELAVKGMLPRGPLGRKMFLKLKVFAGPQHAHEAQQPKSLALSA